MLFSCVQNQMVRTQFSHPKNVSRIIRTFFFIIAKCRKRQQRVPRRAPPRCVVLCCVFSRVCTSPFAFVYSPPHALARGACPRLPRPFLTPPRRGWHPRSRGDPQAGAATISGMIRLTVPAGKAAPAPPVGPALGQKVLAAACPLCRATAPSWRPRV